MLLGHKSCDQFNKNAFAPMREFFALFQAMDATDERYPGHAAVIAYFRDVDSVDCTYAKFLHALRDVILESPPFTEDWSGLDGTWYRRYARLAKEPSAHLPMKLFFEDIIRERKQRIKIAQNTENDRSNRSPLRQTYASRLRKRDDIQRSKAAPAARNAKEELVALEDKWENELEASEDGDEKSDSDSDDSNPFKDMSLPRSKAGTAPADYSYKPKEGRREKMLQKEPEKYPAPSGSSRFLRIEPLFHISKITSPLNGHTAETPQARMR
ncbi:hypothetical protein BC938DRAFT_483030 [Jimgerdemannia flammicorona]|uniref:Uncharacterized protein n=1 Tax=Jimgerdemannia flammicorona TaxID=994334 RepID=A0A433QCQ2_9FUNG|nr:hypothetical protein BC938DRAFT_483030 [Jimgerdemannia flammicorona]